MATRTKTRTSTRTATLVGLATIGGAIVAAAGLFGQMKGFTTNIDTLEGKIDTSMAVTSPSVAEISRTRRSSGSLFGSIGAPPAEPSTSPEPESTEPKGSLALVPFSSGDSLVVPPTGSAPPPDFTTAPSYCRGTFDPVNRPDTIDLLFSRTPVVGGGTVSMVVRNSGNTASGQFTLRIVETFRRGSGDTHTRMISSLRPGETRTLTWDLTGGTGNVESVQFTLDSLDVVSETNECNNITEVEVVELI